MKEEEEEEEEDDVWHRMTPLINLVKIRITV